MPEEGGPHRDDAPLRLVIVDDHPVVRDGLRGMFTGHPEFAVVGEAADGMAALAVVESLAPDVILMDLRMPRMDGVSAIRQLAERGSGARVLVLTTYDTDADVLPAVEAGATGYLLKDATQEQLFDAIRATARGDAVLSPAVATRLMGRVRKPAAASEHSAQPLSERELEVLTRVALGLTNRETGRELHISEATVKTHLLHLYEKLGVTSRAAAVAVAYDRGLLAPGDLGGSTGPPAR